MKSFRSFPIFIGICGLLIGSAPVTTRSTSAAGSSPVDALSQATLQELSQARSATAKYHDFDRADADGYEFLQCLSGEGLEYVNWSPVDCNFDVEHPEALHYIEQEATCSLWVWSTWCRWRARPQRQKDSQVTKTNGSLWQKVCPSGR